MEQEQEISNYNHSDEENQINSLNNSKVRNIRKIVDSDSDTDLATTTNNENSEKTEEENDSESGGSGHIVSNSKKKLKRISMLDSDSEEDIEITPHNKSFTDDNDMINNKTAAIYSTNSKGKLVPENSAFDSMQKSRLSALCDSESSDENSNNFSHDIVPEEEKIQPKQYKKVKRNKEKQPKTMTGKEAAEQRKEIRAESQRMLRESRISLPYHKPKSYSLKEFLEKRSKLASALPPISKVPPSVAIKMSKDQLEVVSKKLNERIKEVEEFYKSESESEDESDTSKEEISAEIKTWIELLIDNACDTVDSQTTEINQIVIESDKPTSLQNIEQNDCDKNDSSEAVELGHLNQEDNMDYDFNLDDLDGEESNDQFAKKNENVGLPDKKMLNELLKEKLANTQPKLSGRPDEVIDLDEGVTKPNEVKKLVERFFQHTARKHPHKHKVELNVVSVSGGEIHKETVAMNVDEEEEPVVAMEIPGAKLQKLREELQNQMALRRSEQWQQKQNERICPVAEKVYSDGEKSEDDILDDEEEVEMTESSSEDEIEEEYVEPKKLKVKSAFVDDEAEESDIQEEDDEDDGFQGDDETVEDDGETAEDGSNLGNDNVQPKKKVLKRIVQPFDEDSDEDLLNTQDEVDHIKKVVENSTDKREQGDSVISCEEDKLPPNQPRIDKTPQRLSQQSKSVLDFLTPVTYLTGLQNLNSDSKFLKESPVHSPFCMPSEPSPLRDKNWQSGLQKKLFQERSDSLQSQNDVEELTELCSGKFPNTQDCSNDESPKEKNYDEQPSTQDLLNICSGQFTGFSQSDPENPPQISNSSANNPSVSSEKQMLTTGVDDIKEIKSLDEDQDQIITQLLNEEELEQFKRKFDSPIVNNLSEEIAEEVNATGLINSDDEGEELELKQRRKKKKLVFSDDENSDEDDADKNDEEINLHDTDGEDSEKPVDNIGYDSEENEIDLGDNPKETFKINNFFENEAELSESEWGSADEDEKDLDDMESEQGDDEVFDENKMRTDLEKIHMRRMLDDDNHEVKLLQELLLEDGELHGSGRQRQFRWKNIDAVGTGDGEKPDDEDIYLEEEESEEQWRKMRHQREMFLKQKSATEDVSSILNDSQVLRIGQKVIKKSQSLSQKTVTSVEKTDNFIVKQSFSVLSKRGSFLARKDQVLERVAEYNKVSTNISGPTKNSRNFVFQTVSNIESGTAVKDNKRKATDDTPKAIKKLRLTDLSPAVNKKTAEKPGGSKKLFANW